MPSTGTSRLYPSRVNISQKCDFPIELIVHDDASTDGTADIIREYAERYSDAVKPIYQSENQYSKGRMKYIYINYIYPLAQGEFLAYCECDDYWSDDTKLGRQVEAMRLHPQCHMCVHKTNFVDENSDSMEGSFPQLPCSEGVYNSQAFMRDLARGRFFHTSSFLVRKEDVVNLVREMPSFYEISDIDDMPLLMYFGQLGNNYYIDRIMSCYRKNSVGSWSSTERADKEKTLKHKRTNIEMYWLFDAYTHGQYADLCKYWENNERFMIAEIEHDYVEMSKPQYREFFGGGARPLSPESKGGGPFAENKLEGLDASGSEFAQLKNPLWCTCPKVSIIVPAYDVYPYLSRCLNSVLCQDFEQLELVAIDDGSTDGCGGLLDWCALQDTRVCVAHQRNCGVSRARNVGLSIAVGEYVAFVDADDYVRFDMVSQMVKSIEKSCADIVCCNWYVKEGEYVARSKPFPFEGLLGIAEFAGHIFDMPISVGGGAWNKLFRRKRLKSPFDETLRICEDTVFVASYCAHASKAYVINDPLYTVVNRPGSATRSSNNEAEELKGRLSAIEAAAEVSPYVKEKAQAVFLDRLYGVLSRGDAKESELERFISYARSNLAGIIRNKQIYWKTKLLYFGRFLFGV